MMSMETFLQSGKYRAKIVFYPYDYDVAERTMYCDGHGGFQVKEKLKWDDDDTAPQREIWSFTTFDEAFDYLIR